MTTYYLTGTDSDLTGGADFNKVLAASAGSGTLAVSVAKGATDTSYFFTAANDPLNAAWGADGGITVKVVVSSANSYITLSVQADRISSTGSVIESDTATGTQTLSSATTYTFSLGSNAWTAGSDTDRLRLRFNFTNTYSKGGSQSVTLSFTSAATVTTNIVKHTLTTPAPKTATLRYCAKSTPDAKTATLQYCAKTTRTPVAGTTALELRYEVQKAETTTTYTITPPPELTYRVLNSNAITPLPELTYRVLNSRSITPAPELTYRVSNSHAIDPAPELTYRVSKSHAITPAPELKYKVSASHAIDPAPELTYRVSKSHAITPAPELTYCVSKVHAITPAPELTYRVSKAHTITPAPELKYRISVTPDPKTSDLKYCIQTTPDAQTKSLTYEVYKSTSHLITPAPELTYRVITTPSAATRDLKYSVLSTSAAITESAKYTIIRPNIPITNAVSTFSRSGPAFESDGTQVADGVPRFESAGIWVEEGDDDTNICQNPNFAANTTGWTAFHTVPTMARTQDYTAYGDYCLKVTNNNDTDMQWGAYYSGSDHMGTSMYLLTSHIKTGPSIASGSVANIWLFDSVWGNAHGGVSKTIVANTEYTLTAVVCFPTDITGFKCAVQIQSPSATNSDTIYIGDLRIQRLTNYIQNPRLASDLTYWVKEQGTGGSGTLSRVNDGPSADINYCVDLDIATGGGYCMLYNRYYTYAGGANFVVGKQYALSFWAKLISGSTALQASVMNSNYTNIILGVTLCDLTTSWQRFTIPFTAAATGSSPVIRFTVAGSAISHYRLTGLQLEDSAYCTSYADSTRKAETLTIPTSIIDPAQGTIEMVVNVTPEFKATARYMFATAQGANNRILLLRSSGGNLQAFTTDASGNSSMVNITDNLTYGRHRLAMKWSSSQMAFWIDGAIVGTPVSNPYLPTALDALAYIGSYSSGMQLGSQIGDLVISSAARPDEQLAARGTTAPLGADADTIIYLPLNGNLNGADGRRTLRYAVPTTPDAQTKSLKYCIPTTPDAQTKSLRYTAMVTKPAVEKSLAYGIGLAPINVTKDLKYVVYSTHAAIEKPLKYTIPTTPAAQTKEVKYDVIKSIPGAKALKYTIPTTPEAITKTLSYSVKVSTSIAKDARYAVIASSYPINSKFSRSGPAYTSAGVQVADGMPRFEPTTNLLPTNQQSVEVDASGFTAWNGGSIERVTSEQYIGIASLAVTPSGIGQSGVFSIPVTVRANTTYTATMYVKATAGTKLVMSITDGNDHQQYHDYTATGGWQKEVQEFTTDADTSLRFLLANQNGQPVNTFYIDNLCLQEGRAFSGLTIEEGTQNKLPAGWSLYVFGMSSADSTDSPIVGTTSKKYITNGSGSQVGGYQGTSWPGTAAALPYTLSVYIKGDAGNVVRVLSDERDAVNAPVGAHYVDVTLTSTWQRIVISATTAATCTNIVPNLAIYPAQNQQSFTFYVAGWMLENRAYATSYIPINSTRNAEFLTVSSKLIDVAQGTIEMLVNVTSNMQESTSNHGLFGNHTGTANRLILFHAATAYQLFLSDAAGNQSTTTIGNLAVGLHRFAVSWNSSAILFYVDGQQKWTTDTPHLPAELDASFYLGSLNGIWGCNGQISDIVISKVGRDAASLASRGVLTPLASDADTALYMPLGGKLNGADGKRALKYTVPTTPAATTKDVKYVVCSTHAAVTKSLKYTVPSTPEATTKSLRYTASVTKDAITKSLKYVVPGGAASISKDLKYVVRSTHPAVENSLKYTIPTTPTAQTKSAKYDVIRLIPGAKALKYTVLTTPAAITKTLGYSVRMIKPSTKAARYAILTSSSPITNVASIFSRSGPAYKLDGAQVASGEPRFERSGLTVEAGTQNLLTDNQAGLVTGSLGTDFVAMLSANISADTLAEYRTMGNGAVKCTTPNVQANEGFYVNNTPGRTNGATYTASCWVCGSGTIKLGLTENAIGTTYGNVITLTSTPTRYSVSRTWTSTASALMRVQTDVKQGITFWVSGFQIEQKTHATSWFDGGQTRAAETARVVAKNVMPLPLAEGTIECVVNVTAGHLRCGTALDNTNYDVFRFDSNGYFWLRFDRNNSLLSFVFNNGTSSVATYAMPSVGEHRFAIRWTPTEQVIFVDGVKGTPYASAPHFPAVADATSLYIGNVAGSETLDSQIRDIVFSSNARSDGDLTARGTTASLGSDANTILYLPLSGNLNGADGKRTLRYAVPTTPAAQTKSARYAVPTTPAATTKSLRYTASTTKPAITKGLRYVVPGGATSISKDLRYAVKTSPAPTKPLRYAVSVTPDAKTKSVKYVVLSLHPTVKSLKYTIPTTPTAQTKSTKYDVIRQIPGAKALRYTIPTTPTAITKNLKYNVAIIPTAATKSLRYVVRSTHAAITKTLKYTVPSTPTAVTKSIRYTALVTKAAITKGLRYVVPGGATSISKALRYAVKTSPAPTKPLRYAVRTVPAARTQQVKYNVRNVRPLTKDAKYVVRSAHATAKGLKYAVNTTSAQSKAMKYAAIRQTVVAKAATYNVRTVESTGKSLRYTLRAPVKVTKGHKYGICSTPTAITRGLRYTVPSQHSAITAPMKYAILSPHPVAKSLKYTVPTTPAAQTKPVRYDVIRPIPGAKSLRYMVRTVPAATAKSMAYGVMHISTRSIQLGLTYMVNTNRAVSVGITYRISRPTVAAELSTAYVVTKLPWPTKKLTYAVLRTTTIGMQAGYGVRPPVLRAENIMVYSAIDGTISINSDIEDTMGLDSDALERAKVDSLLDSEIEVSSGIINISVLQSPVATEITLKS